MTSFCFKRQQRLLDADDYKSVFDRSEFRASHKKVLMLARPNSKTSARLGLVFGKKNVPRSIDRNRLKRITREQFRLQKNCVGGLDIIVMARATLADIDNKAYAVLIRKLMTDIERQRTRDTNK